MAAIGTVNSTSQQPLLLLMRVKVLSAEFCSWVHPAPNSSGRRDANAKYPLDTGHISPLILLNTPPSVFYNFLSLFLSFRNRGVPLIYLYLPCWLLNIVWDKICYFLVLVCCIWHYPWFCSYIGACYIYLCLCLPQMRYLFLSNPHFDKSKAIHLAEITPLIFQACDCGDPPLCCIAWDREGVGDSAQWDRRELERTSLWAYRRRAESDTQWHGRGWVCPEYTRRHLMDVTHLKLASGMLMEL